MEELWQPEVEEAEKWQRDEHKREAEEAEKQHDKKHTQESEEWKRETEDVKLSLIHI